MTWFLVRRTALATLVVAGVVILTFAIARVVPGDPAATWAGPKASREQVERAREELGLDRPLVVQIASFFGGVATGEWGTSLHTRRPVLSDIARAAPASLELVVAALVLAVLVGVPLGLLAARRRGRAPDWLARLGSVLGVSMPSFWLALILQLIFFRWLRLLPVAGRYDPALEAIHPLRAITNSVLLDSILTGNLPILWSAVQHLVLPAVVLAAYPIGVVTLMVRASVLETMGEDHIRMVRALGFPERTVFRRFALRLAWNPVLAVLALVFAYSLANSFLVEAIFNWPGLGAYAAASIASLDTPAIVGVTLFVAVAYVVGNLVVDLVQAAIDPRIAAR